MRTSNATTIGVLAAIPFLLSLLGLSAFIYAANVALTAAEREDLARRAAAEAGIVASAESDRERLAALRDQQRALEKRLAELVALQQQAENARTSRGELEEELAKIDEEVQRLQARAAALGREIDAKESVPANTLVPSGSRKPAVFVECDEAGVLLMPERRRLSASPTATEREAFLGHVETTGYAVFLIRPKGLEAFEAYRRVIEERAERGGRKIDVGFEPVDADWKLAYPKPTPEGAS